MARRYARDNRGRFAPKGAGATARGGRLKTASGNKRKTQTKELSSGKPGGTIGKPSNLKPQSSRQLRTGIAVNRMRAVNARMGTRPDTAVTNIPMSGSRGRRLNAAISRNVAQQKAASRAADKAANRRFKSEQSRAKKLREVHVPAIAKAKGLSKGQVESALKAQTPSTQIKALKNWVKQNRSAAKPAATAASKPRARKVDLSQAAFESRASKTEKRARAAEKAVQGADRSNPRSRRAFNRADALRSAADSYSSLARRGRTGDLSAATLFQGRSRQSTAPKLTRSQKATATRQANKERKFYEQMKAAERSRRS